MWTSWHMHIGSYQSEFLIWGIIQFLLISLDMLLLLLQNNWILPQLRHIQSFIRPLFHMILYSPNLMHLPVMNKFISWLRSSTFTTELVLVHSFIYCLQKWTWVFQYTSYQSFIQTLVKYTLKDWYIYWGTFEKKKFWLEVLYYLNVRCISIISMHQMDQNCCLILCWVLCLLVYI